MGAFAGRFPPLAGVGEFAACSDEGTLPPAFGVPVGAGDGWELMTLMGIGNDGSSRYRSDEVLTFSTTNSSGSGFDVL